MEMDSYLSYLSYFKDLMIQKLTANGFVDLL